eukprot:3480614-Prymnesium_polylepis.1
MSDAVDGRSAARCRSTIVRQNDTFLQISSTLGCGARPPPVAVRVPSASIVHRGDEHDPRRCGVAARVSVAVAMLSLPAERCHRTSNASAVGNPVPGLELRRIPGRLGAVCAAAESLAFRLPL